MSIFYKDLKIMNAKEARELSEQNRKNLEDEFISRVMQIIKSQTSKGLFECTFSKYNINKEYVPKLRELGYSVEIINDQRDGDYLKISWATDNGNYFNTK